MGEGAPATAVSEEPESTEGGEAPGAAKATDPEGGDREGGDGAGVPVSDQEEERRRRAHRRPPLLSDPHTPHDLCLVCFIMA